MFFVPSGYSTGGAQLMGINAASEGMLRAMARYSGADRLHALVHSAEDGKAFSDAVRGFNPKVSGDWMLATETGRVATIGMLMLPGPGLPSFGWVRRSAGRQAYSLCGVTHTTATPLILDTIASFLSAPVYPWDALICTSTAVRDMVLTILGDQHTFLRERFGPIEVAFPQLPVIPLGVECDDFEVDPGQRQEWRTRLGIGENDVAVLCLGRLSFHAKAHPLPLFQALETTSGASPRRLHLIMAGWFGNEAVEQAYYLAARQTCPSVPTYFVDGRLPEVRQSIWAAADMFVSPVDNVQETFGLAPIEAMAAGLPVIGSDWDGYRETIRDGIDGFRIPTIAVPPGVCEDLALRYATEQDGYDEYIGHCSQAVALDQVRLVEALSTLVEDPARARAMGARGRARARELYDWRHIIGRYQELWEELANRRTTEQPSIPEHPLHPARPDPYHAFRQYPTRFATWDLRVRRASRPADLIGAYLGSPMISFARNSLPSEVELVNVVQRLDGDRETVGSLVESMPQARRRAVWRGIVWLAKYGFVTIG